jgi:hypothetical protein
MFQQTNVPLAAAITAYSRMIINGYKVHCLNNNIGVYYSDTDSLVTDARLPDHMIHDADLGKLKLEHTINEGFFIAPKLYWLECTDGKGGTYNVSRSRGYGGQLTREQIVSLYRSTPITVNKQKWFRSWQEHSVFTDMDSILNISGEFSKRAKVLDSSGAWVDTKPLGGAYAPGSIGTLFNEDPVKPIDLGPPSWQGYTPAGVISIQHQLRMAYLKRSGLLKPNPSKKLSRKGKNPR